MHFLLRQPPAYCAPAYCTTYLTTAKSWLNRGPPVWLGKKGAG